MPPYLRSLLLAWSLCAATRLVAQEGAVRLEVTPVAPVKVEMRGNVCFADFGQDAYAKLRLILPSQTPAADLTIRVGEKLGADGAIDRHPLGSVNFQEWTALLPAGSTTFEPPIPTTPKHANVPAKTPPEIGEVTPFRYAEIEGCPSPLTADSVRQLFVHAPFNDDASAFESSDPTLNAVWALCKHTMKATTAFGVYIDGDRERKPYEADAYINFLSHMANDANPAVGRYTFNYLLAHPTWPTEWSFHMVMLAAADYELTGDPQLGARNYDALKKKLLMEKARGDGLLRAPGIVDWPAAERDGYFSDNPRPGKAQMVGPEINTVVNAFYYHALQKMAVLAAATGKSSEAREFTAKSRRVYEAFNRVFFDAAHGVYIDGEGSNHASLHANLFALAFGLAPPERQAKVADFVEGRGMACSVYGAQYLLEALFRTGKTTAAIKLLTSHDVRSWQHMIDLGSTMTLEGWDAMYKPNLTWNHAWGAAPANIITRFVLGVHPLTPGFARLQIAPQLGGLKWVTGTVPTVHGPVSVKIQAGSKFQAAVDIPAGTTAQIRIAAPDLVGNKGPVLLNGAPAKYAMDRGALVIDPVAPGHQTLEIGN